MFTREKVLIPINISQQHWALAVINVNKKQIEYYDSMCGGFITGKPYIRKLTEALQPHYPTESFSEWSYQQDLAAPQQQNGFDCGVFMLQFIQDIIAERKWTVNQDKIPSVRRNMLLDILQFSKQDTPTDYESDEF